MQSYAPGINTGHFCKAEKEEVSQNCQIYPEEKEQSRRHNFPRLQTTLQSYSNQQSVILMQKQTYESMEQNEEPRNKPTHLQQLIFYKRGKIIQWGKSLFSKDGWESWTAACKSMKLEHTLTLYTKINSK